MSPATDPGQPALAYFQTPANYFWRWAEQQKVVEWQNGTTICYREDLQVTLNSLPVAQLPPLGVVLLLLAACGEGWPESGGRGILSGLTQCFGGGRGPEEELEYHQQQALRFMDVLHALPPELRTGARKVHLFREVLSEMVAENQAAALGSLLEVLRDRARRTLHDWSSGRLDTALHNLAPAVTREQYLNELACLGRVLRRFPNTESLVLRLRTGVNQIPAPLVLPEPATEPAGDLFDQLSQDPRTAGLARLAQRLTAALHIPMHARQASEQSVGGVSDVTNRGNFDRLLLSELAQDDLALVARLVNNEALYLRREAPPAGEVRPHTILLDITLRMWGVPRVFALAAALAWARNSHTARLHAPVTAFALGGQSTELLDLTSLAGVTGALSLLDAAPHAGAALQSFVRMPAIADCLLITDADLLRQPAFAKALAETKAALRFLLTVERSGDLHLYEFQNGNRTLLSSTHFDLNELLFTAPPRKLPRPLTRTDGSAFLQCSQAPLYFPSTGLRVSRQNTVYSPDLGVISITDTGRMLHFAGKDTGARELLAVIESGFYHFGIWRPGQVAILVRSSGLLRVYFFDTQVAEVESVELSGELDSGGILPQAVFKDTCFYVRQPSGTLVFDCGKRKITERREAAFPIDSAVSPDFGQIKRRINNGYSVLQRIHQMGVNEQGELVLDGYGLQLGPGTLRLAAKASSSELLHVVRADSETSTLTPNEQVHFRRFAWSDGSTALVDSRGLLHLRSSDVSVPDITVVLVIGRPTGAWAADGTLAGSPYFIGPHPTQELPVAAFYQQYLQRFIGRLT